jgi:hypothetical protein
MANISNIKGDLKNGKHAAVQSQSCNSPKGRILYRESPPMRRLPYPAIGDQTSEVNICQAPHLAQNVVAGLEGPSGQGMRLCRRGQGVNTD